MKRLLLLALVSFSAQAQNTQFRAPTIAQSKAMYAVVDALYKRHDDENLAAFEDMLADAWVNAHKQEALEKAAKKHQPQAQPEDVWELPYANDWLGCMNIQFDDPNIFTRAKFSTYADHPTLFGWLDLHAEELKASPELKAFDIAMRQLPEWGAKCEEIVRNQTPEGSIDV